MALNSLYCADVPLSSYSLTVLVALACGRLNLVLLFTYLCY